MKKTFTLLLIWATLAMLFSTSVNAQWSSNPAVNTAICTASGSQQFPKIVSDGLGGAIITWQDIRGGVNTDIYAQYVLAGGLLGGSCTNPSITNQSTAGQTQCIGGTFIPSSFVASWE